MKVFKELVVVLSNYGACYSSEGGARLGTGDTRWSDPLRSVSSIASRLSSVWVPIVGGNKGCTRWQ